MTVVEEQPVQTVTERVEKPRSDRDKRTFREIARSVGPLKDKAPGNNPLIPGPE